MQWAGFELDLDRRTHVMGVINVTPDSFSDGGLFHSFDGAVAHGLKMARQGADIIDVGGESTRPFSEPVPSLMEMERVVPVIAALADQLDIPISIDTTKADVAQAALEAGASMINDISALRFDPRMAEVAREAGVPVVLMHMKGRPSTMQESPEYEDLIGEIRLFLERAATRAVSAGIREDLIILDPGIGFGKTFDHNLCLINRLEELVSLGKPLLVGASRKSFIGHVLGVEPAGRITGSIAVSAACVLKGARIIRTHDVPQAVETVMMIDAVMREKTAFD